MKALEPYQVEKLEKYRDECNRLFQKVWGLLPPSQEREVIRMSLLDASYEMTYMLNHREGNE